MQTGKLLPRDIGKSEKVWKTKLRSRRGKTFLEKYNTGRELCLTPDLLKGKGNVKIQTAVCNNLIFDFSKASFKQTLNT